MKKLLVFLLAITTCIVITGCIKDKPEQKKKKEPAVGSWQTVFNNNDIYIDEEAKTVFENAKKDYTTMELEVIELLAKQVVSGQNYMFLAKGYTKGEEDKATYKIVVVYKNLENKSTITKVSNFDYTKYVNENIKNPNETLDGGWSVESPGKPIMLDEQLQAAFDNATNKLTGVNYSPITLLGTQLVSGTNYAILCYGKSTDENAKEAIYLLTLYEDLNGTQEIVSQAYIDLADYNK